MTPPSPGDARSLDPEDIARKSFSRVRRGFDESEVRAFLISVAADLRAAEKREREAGDRISALEAELAEQESAHQAALAEAGRVDAQQLEAALGDEARRVLDSARLDGEHEADLVLAQARDDAAIEIERARQTGRDMVIEARVLRERILTDLARRRQAARAQIERLQAGRDRLVQSYDVVRRSLDDVTAELQRAPADAKRAADIAARRIQDEPTLTVAELEEEVAQARLAGLTPEPGGEPASGGEEESAALDDGDADEAADRDSSVGDGDADEAADRDSSVGHGDADEAADRDSLLGHGDADEAADRDSLLGHGDADEAADRDSLLGGDDADEAADRDSLLGDDDEDGAWEDGVGLPEDELEPQRLVLPAEARGKRGLFRRRPAAADQLPESELVTVVPAHESETVRVVGDDSDPEPTVEGVVGGDEPADEVAVEGVVEEDEPADEVAVEGVVGGDEPADEVAVEGVVGGDEPADEVAVEGVVGGDEPADEVAVEGVVGGDEPADEVAVEGDVEGDEPADEVAVEGVVEGHESADEVADPQVDPPPPVEDLFARIRAEQSDETPADDELTPDPALGQAALDRRAEMLADPEKALARALKREMADEQNEVLDRLRRRGTAAGMDVMGELDVQIARYVTAAKPPISQAAAAGARSVSDDAEAFDDAELSETLDALARELVIPLRAKVEAALTGEGLDEAEAGKHLRDSYRESRRAHLDDMVREAMVASFGIGVYAAIPRRAPVRWVLDESEGPCLDGQRNARVGAVARGRDFPSGVLCPPTHPACRCLLLPLDH